MAAQSPFDDVPLYTTTHPCPECGQFIAAGTVHCRHCNAAIDLEAARRVHREHLQVTQAVAGANNARGSITLALLVSIVCPVLMLSGERYVFQIAMLYAAIAFGFATTVRSWLKTTERLQSVDPDLPRSVASMRLAYRVWLLSAVWMLISVALVAWWLGLFSPTRQPN